LPGIDYGEVQVMNDSGFSDLIRDRRAQLVKEALHCREAGELLELARKYQLELSEEEARQLWQIIQGQIGLRQRIGCGDRGQSE